MAEEIKEEIIREISKIRLPDNIVYDIKDDELRNQLKELSGE